MPTREPLVLSFEPIAIREHFEDDPRYSPVLARITDAQLHSIGEWALHTDSLYELYHKLLVLALREEGLA